MKAANNTQTSTQRRVFFVPARDVLMAMVLALIAVTTPIASVMHDVAAFQPSRSTWARA